MLVISLKHVVLVGVVVAAPDLEEYENVIRARHKAYGSQNGERERLVKRGAPEHRQSDEEKHNSINEQNYR